MNLHQKLAEVGRSIGFLEFDAKNDFQNYGYASAANLLHKVNGELFSRNVSVASRVEVIGEAHGPIDPNKVMVRLTLIFTDGDNPDTPQVEVQGLGCGQDKGDKAIMKAFTAAHKYAYTSAFALGWGKEDPEADTSTDKQVAKERKNRAKENGPTVASLLARIKFAATLDGLPSKDEIRLFKDDDRFAELKSEFNSAVKRIKESENGEA